jgi:hypothetical protein
VAPEWVHELQVTAPAGEAMPVVLQFWDHNTRVMDLQEVPASGQIRLSPSEGGHWPARIGFRMSSRRFQQLEVRGAQRIVLNVAGEGTPVTAELPPGIYDAGTPELRIGWGGDGTF